MQKTGIGSVAIRVSVGMVVFSGWLLFAQDIAKETVAPQAAVEFKLADVFGDNMILQAGRPVPVWGRARAGACVEVSYAGKNGSATADGEGKWHLLLEPVAASSAGGTLVAKTDAAAEHLALTNIVVGEVWLASGQSNMEMALHQCEGAEAAIKASRDPLLRVINVVNRCADTPQETLQGTWREASPSSVRNISGAAYFFAKRLRVQLGVPVGIIQADWGGTPIAAWIPHRTLEEHPLFTPLLEFWQEQLDAYPEKAKIYETAMALWKQKKGAGEDPGKQPARPVGPGHRFTPSGLYNGMIHPVAPFAMRGVIWYQGEHDTARSYQYRELFQSMINDWRMIWGQGDFPFLFVQLPNLGGIPSQPAGGSWSEMREAQAMALRLPCTAMAVTYDVGEADQIHPHDKKSVGERLALAALGTAYGRPVVASGPVYRAMEISNGRAVISFDSLGGGLVTRDDGPLKGFAIAGRDRVFKWAEAELHGDTVICSHPEIPEPVAVRYAWDSNPQGTLYNKEGLPAAPFRTDLWPGRTIHERRGM